MYPYIIFTAAFCANIHAALENCSVVWARAASTHMNFTQILFGSIVQCRHQLGTDLILPLYFVHSFLDEGTSTLNFVYIGLYRGLMECGSIYAYKVACDMTADVMRSKLLSANNIKMREHFP